jgi:hypothetical protein
MGLSIFGELCHQVDISLYLAEAAWEVVTLCHSIALVGWKCRDVLSIPLAFLTSWTIKSISYVVIVLIQCAFQSKYSPNNLLSSYVGHQFSLKGNQLDYAKYHYHNVMDLVSFAIECVQYVPKQQHHVMLTIPKDGAVTN